MIISYCLDFIDLTYPLLSSLSTNSSSLAKASFADNVHCVAKQQLTVTGNSPCCFQNNCRRVSESGPEIRRSVVYLRECLHSGRFKGVLQVGDP